jgi:threonine/homoserine/homoserine lactone efflux protein
MNMEVWIPFLLASVLILIIPGPTIILVISRAATHGRRSIIPLVAGVFCGDFTAMTLSLLGLGAVVSASAAVFSVLKWIGALYLIYLGIRQWQLGSGNEPIGNKRENTSARSLFGNLFVVTALNPKSIAFFVAFLPQFIDPLRPVLIQLIQLGGTFLFLAVLNAGLYALFAGRLGEHMRKKNVLKYFNRCGGIALIGAGIFTAGMKRSA